MSFVGRKSHLLSGNGFSVAISDLPTDKFHLPISKSDFCQEMDLSHFLIHPQTNFSCRLEISFVVRQCHLSSGNGSVAISDLPTDKFQLSSGNVIFQIERDFLSQLLIC